MRVGDYCKQLFRGGEYHIDLEIETKGDNTREEIEDNAIRMISVQRKALEVHAAKFKEKLNYELKEANDAKPPQK